MSTFADLDPDFLPILKRCQPATMTSIERLYGLYKSVAYVSAARIPGDIVECGVWRGGSMMCAAMTLRQAEDTDRRLFLYDTFEGMVPPLLADVDVSGQPAAARLSMEQRSEDSRIWAYAPIETVHYNMASTGYPEERIVYVRGPVEKTIPETMPDAIAVLRLDTDWYASTRHELEYLFPRLVRGGVLIIDDYGHWKGARRAVDEYFDGGTEKILLNRIDYTGRVGVRC